MKPGNSFINSYPINKSSGWIIKNKSLYKLFVQDFIV